MHIRNIQTTERSKESSQGNKIENCELQVPCWCNGDVFTNEIFIVNVLHSQTTFTPRLKTIICLNILLS
jgi:hypothetical protein